MTYSDERGEESCRQRAYAISPDYLKDIITQGWRVDFDRKLECIKGLPLTAKFIRGYYDHIRELIVLIFEHESFDELKNGDIIPQHAAVYQQSWIDK